MPLNKLLSCIPVFAICSALGAFACANDSSPGDRSVLAVNPLTGEQKEFPDEGEVPSGWKVCEDDVCPEPVACTELDESSCLVREDCAGVYSGSGAKDFCVGSDTEFCAGGFESCSPVETTTCAPEQCAGNQSAAPKCADSTYAEQVCVGQKGGCAATYRCGL